MQIKVIAKRLIGKWKKKKNTKHKKLDDKSWSSIFTQLRVHEDLKVLDVTIVIMDKAPDKNKWGLGIRKIFFLFLLKIYIVCTHASNEHHSICFCGEIRIVSTIYGWKKVPWYSLHVYE